MPWIYRRSPRLEIEYEGDGGGHVLRALAADGKSALGSAPTLVLMDERGHWPLDRGNDLEHALLSGLGKRSGRALIISTSAADDTHPFSRWIDDPQPGVYVQEHRPSPGLPADDRESLLQANPGALAGIGSGIEWLEAEARRSIARGGSALTAFRLYNRNERVSGETRDLLLTVDEWLACEASDLPERDGQVIIGIDLGGSASMTAAAFFWPDTGRLEVFGITSTAIGAAATWSAFRSAITRFMTNNAATGPSGVKVLIRPEVWAYMDSLAAASAAPLWEIDRLMAAVGAENVTMSANALAALTGSPLACNALLTTTAGGTAPIFVGMWGAVDLIRDPFSDAQSGGLRLTALATIDVTVARGAQIELLTGLRVA